jgi:hypothetical protein
LNQANKSLNHYIAIFAVIALIEILFAPAVSAGKIINYGPIQGTIKTLPLVKYIPATTLVIPKIPSSAFLPLDEVYTIPSSPISYIGGRFGISIPMGKITNPGTNCLYINRFIPKQNPSSTTIQNETPLPIYQNPDDAILWKIQDTTLQMLLDPDIHEKVDPLLNQIDGLYVIGVMKKDPILGDIVYVEVNLEPGIPADSINPYVYQITSYNQEWNMAYAWVPTKELYALASVPEVLSIRLVVPAQYQTGQTNNLVG